MRFKLSFLLIVFLQTALAISAQTDTKNYKNTRRLLLKIDSRANKSLKKLFEQASERWMDMVVALDDEQTVSINAQKVLLYIATPEAVTAIEDWKIKCARENKTCYSPKMVLVSKPTYLEGNDSDIEKLILKNKRLLNAFNFNNGQARVSFMASHKASNTVLLELVEGELFTSGWRVSIRLEDGRWRLLSDNNEWVH